MKISDINAEIRDLCDADSSSLPDATLLRRVNLALEKIVGWIMTADGVWQFDDTNFSDLPEGLGTLVASQQDYSFASEYLEILDIKVKSAGGTWDKLTQLDQNELSTPLEERYDTPGMPEKYDILGDTIRLYPAPIAADVTLASGLKIKFKRTADLFTAAQVTTGTKEPGIPSPWHDLVINLASKRYIAKYHQDRLDGILADINNDRDGIIKHLGGRNKDHKAVMTTEQRNFE